ncbi:MAG: caspase family protein [Sandarakinorhabdus sp.]|nr:caspase family protein [Sandarakinorhabdus sp.]
MLPRAASGRESGSDAARARAFVLSSTYRPPLFLPNTDRDGELVAATFRKLRFADIVRLRNADPVAFATAFDAYLAALRPNSIAVIYLCGHGVQIAGQNYILLNDGSTFVGMASMIEAARRITPTVVVLLDACRNNPYVAEVTQASGTARALSLDPSATQVSRSQVQFRDVNSGTVTNSRLSTFELQGSGVKIVFATDPQNYALDGALDTDINSPFANALARRFLERRSLDDIVSMITGDVIAATEGSQSPWSQGSLGRPIFLAGPPANPVRPPFQVPG